MLAYAMAAIALWAVFELQPAIHMLEALSLALTGMAALALIMTLYHLWFIVSGVRSGKMLLAGILGPLALFAPSLFEERVQAHLRRHNLWLAACVVLLAAVFLVK